MYLIGKNSSKTFCNWLPFSWLFYESIKRCFLTLFLTLFVLSFSQPSYFFSLFYPHIWKFCTSVLYNFYSAKFLYFNIKIVFVKKGWSNLTTRNVWLKDKYFPSLKKSYLMLPISYSDGWRELKYFFSDQICTVKLRHNIYAKVSMIVTSIKCI